MSPCRSKVDPGPAHTQTKNPIYVAIILSRCSHVSIFNFRIIRRRPSRVGSTTLHRVDRSSGQDKYPSIPDGKHHRVNDGHRKRTMMASSFPPFNKHIFINGGPPSETTGSEISSVESDWGDLRLIAAQLGVANPDDLHVERFKVDRQKLEDMIKGKAFVLSD